MKLAFLTNACLLSGLGGVQVCTQEFLDLFRKIDPNLQLFPYSTDQRISARLGRRLRPSSYQKLISPKLLRKCLSGFKEADTSTLLLNNSDALALAPLLRKALPGVRLVYLSHGPVITDVVNGQRLQLPADERMSNFKESPGRVLDEDLRLRRIISGTVSISASDDNMEKWLGSPAHIWIPRVIESRPAKLQPLLGRIGCISTLNHAPNYDGMVQLAYALDSRKEKVQLRLVGGPESLGRRLARDHPSITYLGSLSDEALAEEVLGWRALVNPIFCMARGCSMKVKTALEQGLPVLTTAIGARGYTWDKEALPLSVSCDELAELVVRVALDDDAHQASIAGAARIIALSSALEEHAKRLDKFLESLGQA
jgi:hypothetical protein